MSEQILMVLGLVRWSLTGLVGAGWLLVGWLLEQARQATDPSRDAETQVTLALIGSIATIVVAVVGAVATVQTNRRVNATKQAAQSAQDQAMLTAGKLDEYDKRFKRQFDEIQRLRDRLLKEEMSREALSRSHHDLQGSHALLLADHEIVLARIEALEAHINDLYAAIEQEDGEVQTRIKDRLKTPKPSWYGSERRRKRSGAGGGGGNGKATGGTGGHDDGVSDE